MNEMEVPAQSITCNDDFKFILEITVVILFLLVLMLIYVCWRLWKKNHSVPSKRCNSCLESGEMLLHTFTEFVYLMEERQNLSSKMKPLDKQQNLPSKMSPLISGSPNYNSYFAMAYADCMVDTYIHGYLKKIVPDLGHIEDRGIKDRIACYKAFHNLSDEDFPFNKIFILIPASGYIPPLLDALDEPGRIEIRRPLEPLVLNRAGVDSRTYKTAVYKMYFRGDTAKHISVALEGAPPLLCLSDSCKENPELRKYKKELIYLFYKRLKEKLEEYEEFENSCELIYWEEDDKKSLADYFILRYIDGKLYKE